MREIISKAAAQLLSVAPAYSVGATALFALSVVLCGLRWRTLLRGMGVQASLRDTSLTIMSAIFISNLTPGRVVGEAFRVAMLRQRTGAEVPRLAASLGYDRLTDGLAMIVMFLIGLPTLWGLVGEGLRRASAASGRTAVLVMLGGMLALGLLLMALRRLRWTRVWLSAFLQRLRAFNVQQREFALALALALLIWVLEPARLLVVAGAFGVWLSPGQLIPLVLVGMLGGLLPTIGGLGVVEGGLCAALCAYGVPLETALAITMLERAISFVLATCVGGLILLGLGGGKVWRLARPQRSS